MKRVRNEKHLVSSIALAVALAVGASAAVAQGKKPPNPGGGGGETTATNNLSYPALDLDVTTAAVPYSFTIAANPPPELGKTFSYGCAKPETIGSTTYPNTSCISVSGTTITYLSAAACTAAAAPCFNYSVEKIFWQKIAANDWSADSRKLLVGESVPVLATNVDWGDNLESRTWPSSSVLRVEVTPYADRTTAEGSALYKGLQMWHVYGQGPSEVWGVRATEGQSPYVYTSPFAIIRTMNAKLNITKIVLGTAACPTAGQGNVRPDLLWNGTEWVDSGGGTGTTWLLRNISYTPELNVGGKWVYGYNWQLRRDGVPASVSKAGWWRLTFYTAPGEIAYAPTTQIVPPTLPNVPEPVLLPIVAASNLVALKGPGGGGGGGGGGETGGVYVPVVDHTKNITYLDICLK